MTIRNANILFSLLASHNGSIRGCHPKESVRIEFPLLGKKLLGGLLPSWVPVSGNTNILAGDIDYLGETRYVEGILSNSKISGTDWPFKPWHFYYDWNFHVKVDPQYLYIRSKANKDDEIECEWDSAFLPQWAWPQTGNRICVIGRWIYDCGHPEDGHRTEIHPPKAIAWFRWEAVKFTQNSNAVRANVATIYLGSKGGYWDQPLNNQDYTFDLYLPERIHADSSPVWNITPKTNLAVSPAITPYPHDDPKLLRIAIPLNGINPAPEDYGVVISAGWTDPHRIEVSKTKHVRVTIEEVFFVGNDGELFDGDEWRLYIGINGQWNVWGKDRTLDSGRHLLNYSVNVNIYEDDIINITACAYETDEVDSLMGMSIRDLPVDGLASPDLSWADVSDPSKREQNAKFIRGAFIVRLGLSIDENMENESSEEVGTISIKHHPNMLGEFSADSNKGKYRITYRIEAL